MFVYWSGLPKNCLILSRCFNIRKFMFFVMTEAFVLFHLEILFDLTRPAAHQPVHLRSPVNARRNTPPQLYK